MWQQLVETYNGVTVSFYVNGVFDKSVSLAGIASQFTTYPLDLGQVFSGNYFSGLIEDIRIYSRALTTAQIAAMFAGSK